MKKCTHAKIILKNLTQKKKTKHTPSGYSLFMHCSFDPTELHSMELHSAKNKLDCYKGKGCMEKFCKDLRGYAMIVINYEKKKKKKRYH